MSPAHVLVVEDDPRIAQLLLDYLRCEGLQASTVADGAVALADIRKHRPDLVILDGMLPGMDGVSVCRAVRQFSDVPIMMVTARVDEIDRLLGLQTGADDYVCKPFSPREVMARVHALLRRAQGRTMSAPEQPVWQIDADALRIFWRAQVLPLTPVEYRMLSLLMGRPGRVYSREQLLSHAHGDLREVSDRTIDTHVKNLRKKIQQVDAQADVLTTVYGVGYRFDAPE
ncbi:response regulator [Limnohabitans sp. Jir72]|uniref:response regulator n=1 Tax=Limnohabitans sp. Jir72 TaxID=1977909 RepID=UPI000D3B590A|nr:response regulator [Limnohabitans sp. Jir72]PUE34450.1 two-component system response regulator BaeR [Limnohabitans sp. Jir72]